MELSGVPGDLFAGYLVEDSDLEYSDCSDDGSSEEEGYTVSNHSCSNQQGQSSDDEFEKEMAAEVRSALKLMASPAATSKKLTRDSGQGPSSRDHHAQGSATSTGEAGTSQYYDEVYFDSSGSSGEEGEAEGTGAKGVQSAKGAQTRSKCEGGKKKFKKLTNDELFYDPNMDEEDEKWVRRQRMAYHNVKVSEELEAKKKARFAQQQEQQDSDHDGASKKQATNGGTVPMPKSDAVLNCPACMTTLCLDCQRHDTYVNQYRAMFVLNCRVLKDEVLTYVPKPSKKSSRKRLRGATAGEQLDTSTDSEANKYHPVRCSNCNTEVAVVDTDEVFHFFNILPSAAS